MLLTPRSTRQAIPAAPGNVQGTIIDSDLTPSWDIPDDDDGVVGYIIYVNAQYTHTTADNSYTQPLDGSQFISFHNDDLVPENGYPCGTSSCVHFGAAALREMGVRTCASLVRAANSQ